MDTRHSIHPLSRLALAALLVGSASCGGDDTTPIGINNVSPLASVGGVILDASTMKPLADATVTVVAGGSVYPSAASPAKTDANGTFTITSVPAGSVIVLIKPSTQTYLDVSIATTITNSAGDYPLGNATLSLGPIGLVPIATSTTAFQVQFVTPDGAQAPQVKTFLRTGVGYVDFSTGSPVAKGTTVTETKSNNAGQARFAGMPDFAALAGLTGTSGVSDLVRIQIPPYDSDKDGVMDFIGKEVSYNVNQLSGTVPTIILSNTKSPKLRVEAASIAALADQTGNRQISNSTIYVEFNWPIDEQLTQVRVYDEKGLNPLTPSKDVTNNLLTLGFSSLNLSNASEYNLTIRAIGNAEGTTVEGDFGAPFFTAINASSAVTATLSRSSGSTTVFVTFSEPIGTGTADQSITGGSCPLYFSYDLDGSGKTGDTYSESGYTVSNVPLYIAEVNPPGAAGKSGISTLWYFTLPNDKDGNPIPTGTGVSILLTRSATSVIRANGQIVADVTSLSVP
jgi:hypothetical protein